MALDSPQRADGLLDRIKAAFERLATQPGMGVARDEIMAGLRSHPVWPYIVFYRLNPKARSIEIVRVLHGARELSGELYWLEDLSSSVGLKVDLDMALLVLASGLYRILAKKMHGYADAQARSVFRDLLNMPATVDIREDEVVVQLHKRAHLPILIDAGVLDNPTRVPWWNSMPLRITS